MHSEVTKKIEEKQIKLAMLGGLYLDAHFSPRADVREIASTMLKRATAELVQERFANPDCIKATA